MQLDCSDVRGEISIPSCYSRCCHIPDQSVDIFTLLPGLLVLPLPVDQTVQEAFVARKVDDTFRMDCTAGSHDAPRSGGVDAQVYREDPVRERIVCRHQGFCFLLEREK
mgnify:FL=1